MFKKEEIERVYRCDCENCAKMPEKDRTITFVVVDVPGYGIAEFATIAGLAHFLELIDDVQRERPVENTKPSGYKQRTWRDYRKRALQRNQKDAGRIHEGNE